MSAAKPFLITGMPMTGTAWLSAFLTTGTSIVYHEPLGRLGNLDEIADLYRSNFYKFVGVSDTGIGLFLDWMMEHVRPRTVILDRPIEEIESELGKIGLARTNYLELLHDSLMKHRSNPEVLVVPYEATHNKRGAEKIYWHLCPGEAFDEVRFAEFLRYRIEIDIVSNAKIAIERWNVYGDLLKDIVPKLRAKEIHHAQPLPLR